MSRAADPHDSSERYVLKDFRGSSHRILAGWVRTLPAGARLLELGCGAGHVYQLTDRRDLVWHGLENSRDCWPTLVRRLGGGALVDLETLERLPRGYQAMLAADTLEHLSDPEAMLGRIYRALPAGGRVLLSVPNVANLSVRAGLLLGRFDYADRGILDRTHRVFFTRKSLRQMLARAGFQVEREAASTIPLPLALPRWPAPVLDALGVGLEVATRLRPTLLGFQLLVEARRS